MPIKGKGAGGRRAYRASYRFFWDFILVKILEEVSLKVLRIQADLWYYKGE